MDHQWEYFHEEKELGDAVREILEDLDQYVWWTDQRRQQVEEKELQRNENHENDDVSLPISSAKTHH